MSGAHRRFGAPEWFLAVSFLLLVGGFLVVRDVPAVAAWVDASWGRVASFSLRHGYLGIFFLSWIGNSTIVLPFPYTAFVFLSGSTGLHPLLIGLAAGLGASLGESLSYVVGFLGRAVIRDEHRQNVHFLRRLIGNRPTSVPVFLFLLGVTPIPDDVFLIPLGLMRYPFLRSIAPFALGKIILTTVVALTGRVAIDPRSAADLDTVSGTWHLLTIVGSIIMVYAVLKINWRTLAERYLLSTEKNAQQREK